MCRLMAYLGPQILVADVVLWPSRSIIKQSYDARERRSDSSLPFHLGYGNLNGDGFGIGWYSACARRDRTPCTFTSVTPAWNNDNLNRLATKLESGLIFAHVRAAYPGMPVSEQNCHPFAHGNYLFMHNGVVAGFLDIRRRLLGELSDAAYNSVQSFHSDSAVSFAVFLNHLPSMVEQLPAEALLRAMQATIATISRVQREAGVTDTSLLNFVVSDGSTMVATRFVSKEGEQPASLYYAEGSDYERSAEHREPSAALTTNAAAAALVRSGGGKGGAVGARSGAVTGEGDYHLVYGGTGARVCLIASEPVTERASDWTEVPRNMALVVCREKGALLTVLTAPLTVDGEHPRQEEVRRCLEAVAAAGGIRSGPAPARLSSLTAAEIVQLGGDCGGEATPRIGCSSSDAAGKFGSQLDLFSSASGAVDGAVEEQAEHRLTGHKGPVMALCLHGDYLFSGSTDTTVKVWCLRDCKYLRTLHGHENPIRQLAVGAGALVSAGAKTVRLWSLADFSCKVVLQASDIRGSIKALAVGPDGTIYTGGQACKVKAFPAADLHAGLLPCVDSPRCMLDSDTVRSCVSPAQAPAACSDADNSHCASVTALAMCGDYVCSGSSDSTIRVWRAGSLQFVRALRGHRGSVLALHAAAGLLLSGGRDQLLRVWDGDTLVCRRALSGHTDDILHITSLSAPSLAATASFEMGELASPQAPAVPGMPPPPTLGAEGHAAAAADGGEQPSSPRAPKFALLFASSSADGTVRVWSARGLCCLQVFACQGAVAGALLPAMACALTPAFATAGVLDGTIRLYSTDDMVADVARQMNECEARAGQAACSPPAAKRPKLAAANGHANGDTGDACGKDADGYALDPQAPAVLRLERQFERALRAFIRIPTVSADPSKSEDCFRGAKFLLRILEALGAEVKLAQPVEGKNPVLLGRLGTDPTKKTVTFYGHYDVQPAMEPEWETDPFEVSAVDGYLIGRGVSDNKGPVLAFVYAVKELLEERGGVGGVQGGGLPVNVAFLIEGEEENGSIGFRDAVMSNLRWFEGTELVLISNTLWVGERRPCITYGMRGMITASIEVKGPTRDLHSGNEGGVFSEPLADLNKVLASLVDSRHNIMVPGFYNGVRPNMLAAALQRLQGCEEFSMEGYRQALGVRELTTGRSERELLTSRWCQPTLSVVDVRVGTAEDADTAHYRFGPTRFSVIPRAAVGKVSVRFVPDQDAGVLVERLTAHVQHEFAKLRSGNEIGVKAHSVGDWWEANPGSRLMAMAEAAVGREWGVPPLLVREGGTMPVASALEKMLGAPALLVPMGQSSDNCHLANERIRKINLMRGKNVIKGLLLAVGGDALAPQAKAAAPS